MTREQKIARLTLPNVPDDVFTLWLDPLITEHGWPPFADPWPRLLIQRTFGFWQSLRWKKQSIDLARSKVSGANRNHARGLAMAAYAGVPNEYSELAFESEERLERISKYAETERSLPGALIFLRMPSGTLEVVDGKLRLAVLAACEMSHGATCEISSTVAAWVGEPETVPSMTPRTK